MKNLISERNEELIQAHTIGQKDGDDLVPHLPCHIYDVLTGDFLHLIGFQIGSMDGFVYMGHINDGTFRLINLRLKDSFLLLDADPATFLQ